MVPWMRFLGDVFWVFVVPSLGSRHLGFAAWFRSHLLGGWLLVFCWQANDDPNEEILSDVR